MRQAIIDGLIGTNDFETLAEIFEGFVIFNPTTNTIIDAKIHREHALAIMKNQEQDVDLAAISNGEIRLTTWTPQTIIAKGDPR